VIRVIKQFPLIEEPVIFARIVDYSDGFYEEGRTCQRSQVCEKNLRIILSKDKNPG